MHPRMELQRNKIDKNSARVLARLLRSGWFEPVHANGAPATGDCAGASLEPRSYRRRTGASRARMPTADERSDK